MASLLPWWEHQRLTFASCRHRNLWGVEDFEEIGIRHSKYAANRFVHEAAPALTRFADTSPMPFINGIRQSRERIVARTDEDRTDFLRKRRFGKAETAKIIDTVLVEEGRKPLFDFVSFTLLAMKRSTTRFAAAYSKRGIVRPH